MENKGTILIIDDSPVVLEVITDILTAEGYQTCQANCGELALETVAAALPDLILLDINMPGMDGFTVLHHLKEDARSCHIPVILISASTDVEKQVSGIMRGAIDFILKPFQNIELLLRVRTHLEMARLHRSLEQRATELQLVNETLEFEIARREEVELARFKLLDIVDNSLNEIHVFDAVTLRFQYLNQGALQNLGYSIEDMPLLAPYDIKPEYTETEFRALVQPLLSGEQDILVFETVNRRKNGSEYPVEVHLQLSRQENETVFLAIIIDITERKRMEDALKASSALNESLLGAIPFPMDIVDAEGHILFASPLMEETIGRSVGGSHCWAEYRDDLQQCVDCPLSQPIVIGHTSSVESSGIMGGRIFEIFHTGMIYQGEEALMEVFIDITERKLAEESRRQLEQQMLNTQKLESLGVLAGGIAHDFNNILMTVMGNAGLALMRLNPDSPVVENLKQIELAADRAAKLAQQMLAYSGKGKFVIESVDLSHLVEEMTHMLAVSISKSAILRFNFGRGLPLVEADATQLRQVIMNLVINASEAIGERSGIIAITTGAIDCDRDYLRRVWLDEKLPEGLYTFLEVADTGCGMNTETVARLFDPFFSTKFTGRGLGMAAVLGIIRGHKGTINVYSEPGKGTTFKVLLPAAAMSAEKLPAGQTASVWQGGGSVLLVDDEETVRAVGKQMLQVLGFEVLLAADGLDALAVFQANSNISCVILDLTMPHLGGEDTFRELRQLDPQARIIMSSGYNEQEVSHKFAGKGLTGFIQKPYTLSALREVLKKITG